MTDRPQSPLHQRGVKLVPGGVGGGVVARAQACANKVAGNGRAAEDYSDIRAIRLNAGGFEATIRSASGSASDLEPGEFPHVA
jgi:hypothetical protein